MNEQNNWEEKEEKYYDNLEEHYCEEQEKLEKTPQKSLDFFDVNREFNKCQSCGKLTPTYAICYREDGYVCERCLD